MLMSSFHKPLLLTTDPRHTSTVDRRQKWMTSSKPLSDLKVQVAGVSKRAHEAVQYLVHVETSAGCWTLDKRYSEIRAFRKKLFHALSRNTCLCTGACQLLSDLKHIDFPRRDFFHRRRDENLIRYRGFKLHTFMRVLVSVFQNCPTGRAMQCEVQNCQVTHMIKEFLVEQSVECKYSCEPFESNQSIKDLASYRWHGPMRPIYEDYEVRIDFTTTRQFT